MIEIKKVINRLLVNLKRIGFAILEASASVSKKFLKLLFCWQVLDCAGGGLGFWGKVIHRKRDKY